MAKGAKPKSAAAKKKAAARAKKRREEHTKFLTDTQMLHFARTHQPQRPKPCQSEGGCNDYAAKTESGKPPAEMNQGFEAAAHHVLPVAAVSGFVKLYKDKEAQRKNIASVYAQMEWCINKKDNLMWLPYFPAYQRHLSAGKPGGAPKSLAAHNFDHNPHYNDLVIGGLKAYWQSIAAKKPVDVCKKAEEIVERLNSQIGKFKPNLKSRKTQPILDKASDLKQQGKKAHDLEELAAKSGDVMFEWWKAFSMAPDSAKKRPSALLLSRPPRRKVRRAIKRLTEQNS